MTKPLPKDPKMAEKPPIPLPDPDEVRHTFDVAMAKIKERQGFYVTVAVLVLIAAVAAIFVLNLGPSEKPPQFSAMWKRAQRVREKLILNRSAREELVDLAAYLDDARGTEIEGLTLWLLGIYHYREAWTEDKLTSEDRSHDLERAIGYLEELGDRRFDDLLLTKPRWFNESAVTPVAAVLRQVREDLEWNKTNAYTEPLPNPDLVAVLRTSIGDIHVQFFTELASEHTTNFVTLARAGAYNGTYFHFVRRDPFGDTKGVMGGDPYTFFYNDPLRKSDILRWGSGGVGYEIAPEGARYRISHRRSIVTSQMRDQADWDNGVQFMIVTGIDQELDKVHTPFAKVVEGMALVDKIAERKTAGTQPTYKDDYDFSAIATRDLIVEPVTIQKVIVYQKGKALEHAFPLAEGEKTLAGLASTPVQPLTGDALYAGRRMRAPDAEGEIRRGLDVPFPDDVDPEKADPLGERVK